MITIQDTKLIERSLGKQLEPIKTDVSAIKTRLTSVEKRAAAVENRLTKMVTKEEFEEKFSKMVTKEEFQNKTDSIINEIRYVLKAVGKAMDKYDDNKKDTDEALDDHEKRLNKLENKVYA